MLKAIRDREAITVEDCASIAEELFRSAGYTLDRGDELESILTLAGVRDEERSALAQRSFFYETARGDAKPGSEVTAEIYRGSSAVRALIEVIQDPAVEAPKKKELDRILTPLIRAWHTQNR